MFNTPVSHGVPLSPSLATVICEFARTHRLSNRESHVVLLAAWGFRVKEMSFRLGCGTRTVEEYWARIFRKTGLRSRSEILAALLRYAAGVPAFFEPVREFPDMTGAAAFA